MAPNWVKQMIVNMLSDWGVVIQQQRAGEVRKQFKHFGKSWIEEPLGNIQNPQNISIGDGVVIQPHVNLETSEIYHATGQKFQPDLTIGDGACLRPYISIYCNHKVVIGKNVLIGERVCITDVDHRYDNPELPVGAQPIRENTEVVIGDGCFIGYGAIVLPNVHIGKNAVVGAGSVVTRDVPAFSVAVGNPAKVVKQYNPECGV